MKQHYPKIGMGQLCRLFGKSRQAYYELINRCNYNDLTTSVILNQVVSIRQILPKTGLIKLYKMLKSSFESEGIAIGRDRFCSLLRSRDLQLKQRKYQVKTTQSTHRFNKWPNLIEHIHLQQPGQLWVSDITYLKTQSGFLYLSLITDAFSKKIIGHHLSLTLKTSSCIIALKKAIEAEKNTYTNLIHHSDRGIQYCCDAYINILKQNNIAISMTQTGSPYDNAIAERVNGILKHELQLKNTFEGYKQALNQVNQAIYKYNCIRLHMSVGFMTPQNAHLSVP